MDMTKLTEENLEVVLQRAGEEDEGKSIPLSKLKAVLDVLTWARSFLYVCRHHGGCSLV